MERTGIHPARVVKSGLSREGTIRAAAWAAVLSMSVAAVAFWPGSPALVLGLLATIAGGAALAVALHLNPKRHMAQPVAPAIETQRSLRWLPTLLGVVCMIFVGMRGGQQIHLPQLYQITTVHVQVLILFVGIACLVVGVGGLRSQDAAAARSFVIAHRRELMLVAALSGIALAVRVYHLDAVRAFMDEGPFMNALMKMRTDPTVSLTAPLHPVASSTRLFPWTQLIITDLLGDTLSTFRLAGVLFGVATVAATYGLTRLLFDRRTAFLAGLIFATFPPHVHMSRIAIYNIADPLFGVLALLFFVQAIRSRQRLFYALAGASLGLLPYVYEGGELLFPLLLTAWILWLVLSGPPRPSRAGIGWMIFVALAIALPVYYTEWSYSLPLFTRLDDMGLQNRFWLNLLTAPDGLHQMLVYFNEKFLPPLLHYVHNPDASLFYGGQTALVLPIFVPLFLLGLCFTFRYWRRSGALLIFWLLLTTLGNSMIYFNDWTARFVVVMPAVAMLMALGLSHILPLILKAPRWRLYKALAVVICLVQVLYYFGLHLPYYQTQLAELRKHYDVAYRIMALPDDTHVLFFYEDHIQTAFTFSFLDFLGNTRPFDAMQGYEFDPNALSRDENYVIFVDPYNYEVLDKMKAAFYLDGPHYGSPDLPRQFAAYRVTPWLWKDVTEKASLKPVSPHS